MLKAKTESVPAGSLARQSSFSWFTREYRSELGMGIVLLIFLIVMSIASPYFMTSNNMLNVISQITAYGLIAIGQMFVIVTAGIDLSVGSQLGLIAMLMGMTMTKFGIVNSLLVALGTGVLLGVVNGLMIGYLQLPAFIITLGMQSIARSITYVVSNGNSVLNMPKAFNLISKAKLGGIPVYFIITILLFVFFAWVADKTKVGRFIYAIGSNQEAARLSGINVAFYTMIPYVITGILCAMAAIVQSARLMAIDPTFGQGIEMNTIAAVVIGGTSMLGGRGTLAGTAVGVVIIGFITNFLNLMGVNPFWQGTATGVVIIVAVLLEKMTHRVNN